MAAPGWIELFTGPLEVLGVPYMVTGSVASTLYGEPRLTLDVDLVVEISPERVAELLAAYPEGAFYRPPLEIVLIECRRESRGHFNLIHHETGMKADVYTAGRDELHRFGLANRRPVETNDGRIFVAPPEYVILRKLEFWREGGSDKHLRDVAAILATGLALDREMLAREVRRRGLDEAWSRAAS